MQLQNLSLIKKTCFTTLIVFLVLTIIFLFIKPAVISGLFCGIFIGLLNFVLLTFIVQGILDKRPVENVNKQKGITQNFFIKISVVKFIVIVLLCYLFLVIFKVNIPGVFLGIIIVITIIAIEGIKK